MNEISLEYTSNIWSFFLSLSSTSSLFPAACPMSTSQGSPPLWMPFCLSRPSPAWSVTCRISERSPNSAAYVGSCLRATGRRQWPVCPPVGDTCSVSCVQCGCRTHRAALRAPWWPRPGWLGDGTWVSPALWSWGPLHMWGPLPSAEPTVGVEPYCSDTYLAFPCSHYRWALKVLKYFS